MPTSKRLRRLRILEDAVFFIAVALVAFWAMADRTPSWPTPFYVAAVLAGAVLVRRMIIRIRAKHDRQADAESSSAE